MTPEQQALRDAYLAELWPVCRQYHPGQPTNGRRDPSAKRQECDLCGQEYSASNMARHVRTQHSDVVDKNCGSVDSGAA